MDVKNWHHGRVQCTRKSCPFEPVPSTVKRAVGQQLRSTASANSCGNQLRPTAAMASGLPKARSLTARPSNEWVFRRGLQDVVWVVLWHVVYDVHNSNTFSSKATRGRSNILFWMSTAFCRNLLPAKANQAAVTPATDWHIDEEDCEEGDEEDEDLKLKILHVGCMELNAGSSLVCKYIFWIFAFELEWRSIKSLNLFAQEKKLAFCARVTSRFHKNLKRISLYILAPFLTNMNSVIKRMLFILIGTNWQILFARDQ